MYMDFISADPDGTIINLCQLDMKIFLMSSIIRQIMFNIVDQW